MHEVLADLQRQSIRQGVCDCRMTGMTRVKALWFRIWVLNLGLKEGFGLGFLKGLHIGQRIPDAYI